MEQKQDRLTMADAVDLIGSMFRMGLFPEDSEELKRFASTLMDASCERKSLAVAITERLRRSFTFFPTDSEFYTAAQELNPVPPGPSWQPKLHYTCKDCQDTGFRSFTGPDGNDYSGYCSCPEGPKRGRPAAIEARKEPERIDRADFRRHAAGDPE